MIDIDLDSALDEMELSIQDPEIDPQSSMYHYRQLLPIQIEISACVFECYALKPNRGDRRHAYKPHPQAREPIPLSRQRVLRERALLNAEIEESRLKREEEKLKRARLREKTHWERLRKQNQEERDYYYSRNRMRQSCLHVSGGANDGPLLEASGTRARRCGKTWVGKVYWGGVRRRLVLQSRKTCQRVVASMLQNGWEKTDIGCYRKKISPEKYRRVRCLAYTEDSGAFWLEGSISHS